MKQDKVYYIKSIDDISAYLNEKNPNYKSIMHVFLIAGQYEMMNDAIEKIFKDNTNLKNDIKELLYFCLCQYYWRNNNVYGSDKYYYKLNKILKIKMNYIKCKYVNEYNELYDKEFIGDKKYYKDYGNTYYYLYLCNFLRENKNSNNVINKKIVKQIKKILNKKEMSLDDIDYFAGVISITFHYYTSFYDDSSSYPINIELLEKMCNKISNDITLYYDVLKNRIVELNESILLGYRTLITINKDIGKQKELLNIINDFIKNRKVEEYTKFVYNITHDNNLNNSLKYVEMIKQIASGKKDGEILRTILIYSVGANEEELNSFYNEIKDIKCTNNNQQLIDELKVGKLLLRFWLGETINLELLNDNVMLSDFLKLIIEFDNKKYNYQDFIQKLEIINSIDNNLIINWNRLDKIFNNCGYKWLEIIVSKCDNIDNKLINYLSSKYINIINRKEIVELNTFNSLDIAIQRKINNVDLTVLSVWIYFNSYNYSSTYVIYKLYYILDNYETININIKDIKSFVMIMVLHIIYDKIEIDFSIVKKMIDKYLDNMERSLCYLALYYLDNKFVNKHDYLEALNIIYNVYINDCKIDNQLHFALINLLASMDLIDKKTISIGINDTIYLTDNKTVVLNEDYNENFNDYYNALNAEVVDKVKDDAEKTTLMESFIVKIFFINIEKFNAGKMIQIRDDLDGKQIIEELLNAIGYNEGQRIIRKIKDGTIVESLWLNAYNVHQFMKDIKSDIDYKYKNSKNVLLSDGKKIIHITSFALLTKLGIVKKILDNKKCYITGHIFDEVEKMKKNGTGDLIDGIFEKAVCYDDLIEDMYDALIELDKEKRIEYVTIANTLSLENPRVINDFDSEIFKLLLEYKDNPFVLVTEDPFYYYKDSISEISVSTYSLIIEMYNKKIINSEELLSITKELECLNYNLKVKKDIYYYYLNNSDDDNISKLVDILNKYD